MSLRSITFHPLIVLLLSLFGAALFALYAALRFPVDKLSWINFYVVPIVVPFVAFLFDRADRFYQSSFRQHIIDVLVVGTSMWRAVGNVPFISGHVLFLTYALLSTRSRVARISAAVVMLQVVYLKYVVWHDWITPTSGIVVGLIAALLTRRFRKTEEARVIETATS